MTAEALVLTIDGAYAEVRRRDVTCAACNAEACTPTDRLTRALIGDGLDVRVDDWVEIRYSTAGAIVDGLVLLGIPALGFAVGYALAPRLPELAPQLSRIASDLAPTAADPADFFSGDVVRAIVGLVGFALGAVAPFLRARLRTDPGLPEITRVVRRRGDRSRTPSRTAERPGA